MDNKDDGSDRKARTTEVQEMALDLNFVPEWARRPPDENPYPSDQRAAHAGKRDRHDRRHDRNNERGRDGRRPRKRFSPAPSPRKPPEQPEYIPIEISFVPEQKHLSLLIADIRASKKAYPLPELASLFLKHPENHMIKFASRHGKDPRSGMTMYQDRETGLLFLDREECLSHIAKRLLATEFEKETVQIDPPAGQYVCVARCRLSGVLMGPPNHHEYNERIEEVRRARFPNISPDEYRRNIETVRDPELIDRWKEEWRTRTVYRLKNGNGETAPMNEQEAMEHVRARLATRFMVEGHRFVVSGPRTHRFSDARLRSLLQSAWTRESRMPVTLIRALRSAFRRLGLHVFRTRDGKSFVTAIPPHPVDPEHAVKAVGDILAFLEKHPGCSRHELLKGVNPWAANDPSKIPGILKPVQWLVERGHVVEFHNGTLAIPGGGKKASSKK